MWAIAIKQAHLRYCCSYYSWLRDDCRLFGSYYSRLFHRRLLRRRRFRHRLHRYPCPYRYRFRRYHCQLK